MAVITIREQSQAEKGFNATLVIEGNNYSITVKDPFEAKEEQELEWYFEEWLSYPMLDNVKVDRAKDSIKKYGEELFKQVFQADIKAYSKYSQLRNDLSKVQIEIESITPEFHAIHWEVLQDPDLPRPLAVDTILIRKSVKPAVIEAKVNQSPTINLLVVTARPNAESDVGYRTISRPLVKAIRNAKLRVNIELLRPGTYEALERHLESKGSGYYHIVHFDVHGALKTYEDYQEGVENNRYLYKSRFGRSEIEKYEGLKAFLALEGKEKGEYDLVEAKEIANLLTGKGIPVCILNACQSGKQLRSPLTPLDKDSIPPSPPYQRGDEDNRETSLGSRLMNAGMQMVVGMSYSVTVTAAKIMMEKIYEHLFDEQDINQAIRLGRRELYNRKGRRAYYNTEIELEDWLLPVAYCNGKVDFNLKEFSPEEEEKYFLSLDSKYEFKKPTYGFVGRDIDILLIEKALLQHNILLLQGMGGTGKTTLLNYLREWWQVTNFAEDIFYFGYDEKAHTLQQIVYDIGQKIYNRFEFATFQAQKLTVQWRKLSQKLKAENYILILDNLESVTGQPLAIQNTLDEAAREEIKKFLADLVGGKTKVVLGSRIGEEWLKESTFRDNIYQLRGLDAQARTDLAENILQRVDSSQSLDAIKTDEHFERLMKLLAGYPLAMEVVLVNLKNQSPQEILEQLEKAEINPGGEDKTNNIVKCIDYSHSNLSESAQKLLLLLAPFRGFINTFPISHYIEELAKLEPFQDYDLEQLESAVTEAIKWGLLSPIDQTPKLLTIQPILPYFLNTKLKEADKATRESLQEGFKTYYQGLALSYTNMMNSKEPQERRWGIRFVQWEYENLYQALQISLKRQESVYSIWSCLLYFFDITKSKNDQLQLADSIYKQLSKYNPDTCYESWETEFSTISANLAKCYVDIKNYQKAIQISDNTLSLISKFRNIEEADKQNLKASLFNHLAISLSKLGEFQQAKDYYQQALDLCIEFGDPYVKASILNNLGELASGAREFQQAKDYYQQALDLYIEFGDPYGKAQIFHQLGKIDQELRKFRQAIDYYQKALNIYVEHKERYEQARVFHSLGIVDQELGKYRQARDYYQKALNIYIEHKERYGQALILQGLGVVSSKLSEYSQARDYFQQALDLYVEFGDSFSQARILHNLGSVVCALSEYSQARDYFQQALDLYIECKEHYSQAKTLHELGIVAQVLREYSQAKDYYQQALVILIEYGDRYEQAHTLHNLGSVAQELRAYEQAQDYYQQALSLKIEFDDRFSQARTLHNLGMVAEELSEFEQAKGYYLQALGIFVESKDKQYLGLVVRQLARLYQKNQDNSLITEVAAILEMTEVEVRELFDRFTTDNE